MEDFSSAHTRGFALVEALLALAMFALVVAGLAGGLLYANSLRAGLAARLEARLAVRDCISVLRSLRDTEGIDALPEGQWTLARTPTRWALVASDDNPLASVTVSEEGTLKRIHCSATRGLAVTYTRTLETLIAP